MISQILNRLLRVYFHSGIRGSTKLTNFLVRYVKSLHSTIIPTRWGSVVADLRNPIYRGLFTITEEVTDEEIVMKRFLEKGMVAFDVGVYWGIYTVYMSRLVGENGAVHSFEPNTVLVPSLRRLAQMNSNVVLHEVALSNREGIMNFFIPMADGSLASLMDWSHGSAGEVRQIQCKVTTLDVLIQDGLAPIPNFIKCDVEGAEFEVLSGAVNTLESEQPPIIFFEVNPAATQAFGHEPDICFSFLSSLVNPKYQFFHVLDEDLVEIAGYRDLKFNQFGFTNAIAVPHSQISTLASNRGSNTYGAVQ